MPEPTYGELLLLLLLLPPCTLQDLPPPVSRLALSLLATPMSSCRASDEHAPYTGAQVNSEMFAYSKPSSTAELKPSAQSLRKECVGWEIKRFKVSARIHAASSALEGDM